MSDPAVNDPLLNGYRDNVYPNAFFDYLTKLMPKQLKLLFVWLEYLYVNCGQIFAAIKKFAEYPITEIVIKTENVKLKEKITHIFTKVIKFKAKLINIGLDFFVYGNAFISVHRPFNRVLVCKNCGHRHNARNTDYKWNPNKFEFILTCKACKKVGVAKVLNEKCTDVNQLKILRWDPKYIDINYNPITEQAEYYYNIPPEIVQRLKHKKPDKFLLDTLPWEFILTVKEKKIFKFSEKSVFHLKASTPAGINKEWGFPGLLSAMKPFFYTAILRKANEAIALDHIVPLRVLHPLMTSVNNDPTQYLSLSRWQGEMEMSIKKWRRDPNHIKFSPIPVGITNMGGDGRAMLTTSEVQAAEEGIIASTGVPREFIYGGLTHAGGSVTLRMLENMLLTYTSQLKDCMQWISDEVTDFMNLERVDVDLADFKLVDDVQQKQMVIQFGTQANILSKTTLASLLDQDIVKERKQQLADALEDAKQQKQIEEGLQKIQQAISSKVKEQQNGNPLNYDPMAVMQIAQQQAMQLIQIPMEQRKTALKQLEQQDPVLYAVVLRSLDSLHKVQKEQGSGAINQMQGNA